MEDQQATQENREASEGSFRQGGGFLVGIKTENVTVDPDEINDNSAGEEGQGAGDDYQGRTAKE